MTQYAPVIFRLLDRFEHAIHQGQLRLQVKKSDYLRILGAYLAPANKLSK